MQPAMAVEEVKGAFDASCTFVMTVPGDDVVTGVVGLCDSGCTFVMTLPGDDVVTGEEIVGFFDSGSTPTGDGGEAATSA